MIKIFKNFSIFFIFPLMSFAKLDELPIELFTLIVSYLEQKDLLELAKTNSNVRGMIFQNNGLEITIYLKGLEDLKNQRGLKEFAEFYDIEKSKKIKRKRKLEEELKEIEEKLKIFEKETKELEKSKNLVFLKLMKLRFIDFEIGKNIRLEKLSIGGLEGLEEEEKEKVKENAFNELKEAISKLSNANIKGLGLRNIYIGENKEDYEDFFEALEPWFNSEFFHTFFLHDYGVGYYESKYEFFSVLTRKYNESESFLRGLRDLSIIPISYLNENFTKIFETLSQLRVLSIQRAYSKSFIDKQCSALLGRSLARASENNLAFPMLRKLNLSHNSHVNDSFIETLVVNKGLCNKLKELILAFVNIGPKGIERICENMKNLHVFDISYNCCCYSPKGTSLKSDSIKEISDHLFELEELYINSISNLDDQSGNYLNKLKKLQILDCSFNEFTDEFIKNLIEEIPLPPLKQICIYKTEITHIGVELIKEKFPNLKFSNNIKLNELVVFNVKI